MKNRQELILTNLEEANKRAIKAQEELVEAQSQFETAKRKAQEIQDQNISKVNQEKSDSQIQTEEIIKKLEKLKKDILLFQQQKALTLLSKKVIQLSLKQVQAKLQNRVGLKFQNSINNFYIALLNNYESFN